MECAASAPTAANHFRPFTTHISSSDEPATGACSNSRFYCPNVGHQGSLVAVSRVNGQGRAVVAEMERKCNI
jgi:hypothetical protein